EIEKDMFFYDFEIGEIKKPIFEVSFPCSKGSFVRSWVQKLGESLRVGACVEELERTYSEPYSLSNAAPLESLAVDELGPAWIPFNQALPDWPGIVVNSKEQQQILNGLLPPLLKSKVRTLASKNEKVRGI